VAQIDTPLLEDLHVMIFYDYAIKIPYLSKFILRTGGHTPPNEATLHADEYTVYMSVETSSEGNRRRFQLGVSFVSFEPDHWDVRSLRLLCASYLSPLLIAGIERLYIGPIIASYPWMMLERYSSEIREWLDVLRPFTSVEGLYMSEFPRFALVLEVIAKKTVVGELTEELLPALRMIQFGTWNNHGEASIKEFVTMRQRSGRPVTVHQTFVAIHSGTAPRALPAYCPREFEFDVYTYT